MSIRCIELDNCEEVIRFINELFVENEHLMKQEALEPNLQMLSEDLRIQIFKRDYGYYVDMAPISGEGHDFGISVYTKTRSLSISVGVLEPEPEEI
ncbi:MAG: hypothetical protein INQ03_03440 [Candidatus Heimdallarchaeota archaeon]|nr:hypothetical protein [Candidatus Heimdallarchaeota archaeon]